MLCPTHELADELCRTLNRLIFQYRQRIGFGQTSHATVIRGRSYPTSSDRKMCENWKELQKFQGPNLTDFCKKGCIFGAECNYTLQFDSFANIRIGVVQELHNRESAFWNGLFYDARGNAGPADNRWQPDYIVVDETCLDFEEESAGVDCGFSSIRGIIFALANGGSLIEAIERFRDQIRADFTAFRNGNLEPLVASGSTKLLRFLNDFTLGTVAFDQLVAAIRLVDGKLSLCRYREVAERHRAIPKLLLDATADEAFTRTMFPGIEFVDIAVGSKPDINIYQVQNFSGSKTDLSKPAILEPVVTRLLEIVQHHKMLRQKVGFITYKNISTHRDFASYMGEKIGADVVGHFKSLRGTNRFEDVDCLIVLGRFRIDERNLLRQAEAIYGGKFSSKKSYTDVPVRMKNGPAMSLNNYVYDDIQLQSFYNQVCKSETIQAIGRGRLSFGKAKDVYFFSNESLGSDVEITAFIDMDFGDFTDDVVIPESVKAFPFKRASLLKFGFSEHHIKKSEPQIREYISSAGFDFYQVTYRRDSKNKEAEWCVLSGVNLTDFIDGNIIELKLITA